MEDLFLKALPLLRELKKHGRQAYFVGGSVRDAQMNRDIGDIDIATDASPEEIEAIFPKTVDVGKEHGTIIVLFEGESYEVTTFRAELEYEDYRRPSGVQFIKSLKEDLKRRDLTINAMAMDEQGRLIDYFGGLRDIRGKLIQTVGDPAERFHEDALRMLRALRFMSQLEFELSPNTKKAICENRLLLAHISTERKTVEFEKLLKGKAADRALEAAAETGLYKELPGLDGKKERVLAARAFPFYQLQKRADIWAAFIHMISLDSAEAHRFLKGWKLPGKVIKQALLTAERIDQKWDAVSMYEAGEETLLSASAIRSLRDKQAIDEKQLAEIRQSYRALPIKSLKDLAVSGSDLLNFRKKPAGKWVSDDLKRIERAVLSGELANQKKAIEEWLDSCSQI
ncbi:CCA tRNA nucleotidyltransferase [Bacillus paralicheniformis]|uniref:CCA tRNA nucleotidyltransferase n=2 Tax=Bacillus paralicheniformis TaxID=1648923 RepID=UPI00050454F5|nr:CCA tRNA nucleotidyltransferase [Bacillus paralicheniformis]KFM91262.1 CCA-adding enzyme [Bacillus paralicheniformis]MDR4214672.1 CCA tRNA nucleotidyltransferase [Bacillus paralicheniformis]MEC2172330.1 CCA tRNA nucleotidyltransferase [Bacillus paralicheniformis]TWJ83228.1 CCA-adding enzyme [Bacillus paralicheniformis]